LSGPTDTLDDSLIHRTFQAGGGLREGTFYARRRADDDLLRGMLAGEFCNGLAPRQIGKTSLALRTSARLERRGFRCAMIDLNALGAQTVDVDGWYYGLCYEIQHQLGLGMARELDDYWDAQERLGSVHRWVRFLIDRVLVAAGGRVALFLDEIDAVLSLPFSRDDFFAAVRSLHDRADLRGQGQTLVFCLLGVAVARDLVASESRTPFNIGRTIRIDDLSRPEMNVFRPGLEVLGSTPDAWLDEVWGWTHGNPYMSQRMLVALVDQRSDFAPRGAEPGWEPGPTVEQLVHRLFVHHGRTTEANLADAEKRIDREPDAGRRTQMLQTYRRLLMGERVESVPGDAVQLRLRLTGLVAERVDEEGARLAVRNRVFGTVFGLDWVRAKETARLLTDRMVQWKVAGKPPDLLLTGTDLAESRTWAEGDPDRVSPDEWTFLNLCQGAELERERSLRQGERLRAQRRLLVLALIAAVVLAGAFVMALVNAQRARTALVRLEEMQGTEEQARDAALAAGVAADEARLELDRTRAQTEGVTSELDRVSGELGLAALELDARMRELEDAREVMAESESLRERAAQEADAAWSLVEAASYDRARRVSTMAGTPGREMDALSAALDSAAFDLRHGDTVSPGVLSAMNDALRAARRSVPLRGHGGPVTAAAWSGDGSQVATVGLDGAVRLWNGATGARLMSRQLNLGPLHHIAFARRGTLLAAAGSGGGLALIDADGSGEDETLGTGGPVGCLETSRDGGWLALCTADGGISVLDTDVGGPLAPLPETQAVVAAGFGPDEQLVTVTEQGDVVRWTLTDPPRREQPRDVRSLLEDGAVLTRAAVATAGGRVALGLADGRVVVADPLTPTTSSTVTVGGEPVDLLLFAQDGSSLLAGLRDGVVGLVDLRGEPELQVLVGHSGPPTTAGFSPGRSMLATAEPDGTVLLWSRRGELLRSEPGHAGPVTAFGFHPTGSGFVSTSEDGTARLWDPLDSREVLVGMPGVRWVQLDASPLADRALSVSERGAAVLSSLDGRRSSRRLAEGLEFAVDARFSPTGQRAAITGQGGTELMDPASRRLISRVAHPEALGLACLFAPSGTQLAVGLSNGEVRVVRSLDGVQEASLATGTGGVGALAWSDDGALLATGGEGQIQVWSSRDWTRTVELPLASGAVQELAFVGPERLVARTSVGLLLLAPGGGPPIAELGSPSDPVRSFAMAPADPTLAVGMAAGPVILLDGLDGRELGRLEGHAGAVSGLSFAPDGELLASAGVDSSIRLWDWRQQAEVAVLGHHRAAAVDVLVTSDGERVVSAGADGTVRTFEVGVATLVASACDLAHQIDATGGSSDTCAGLLRRVSLLGD
jgi:WD40 repeat protein